MTDDPTKPGLLLAVSDGSDGGGTTHCLQIIKHFQHDWRLGLVAPTESSLALQAQTLGAEVFGHDRWSWGAMVAGNASGFKSICDRFNPVLVHAHGSRAALSWSACGPRDLPWILTVHGLHLAREGGLKKTLLTPWLRRATSKAQCAVFVSKSDQEAAIALQCRWKNTAIISNGVTPDSLPERCPAPTPVIGFVGRLSKPKDPILYLETMAMLPNFRGRMVGDGELKQHALKTIQRLGIKDRIDCSSGDRDHALAEMSRMSALVMPSKWEGLPMALIEAMGMGVPVVGTDVPGIRDVIQHEKNGLMVENRSSNQLAQAVKRLMDENGLASRLSKEAIDHIRRHFSERTMCSNLQEIYQAILKNKP